MNTRYSPSTGSFYPLDIDYGDNLPIDAIEVTRADFDAAMSRPVGHAFDFPAGKLRITAPPPVPLADILAGALAEVRRERAPILASLDGIAGRMARSGDAVNAAAADVAITALLEITKLPALLNATTYDGMKAAVLARYREIAAAAPAVVKVAFAA